MLYQGESLLELGVVDEMHPMELVLDKVLGKISTIVAYEGPALAVMKAMRTEEIRLRCEQGAEKANATVLDCWFSESTQKRRVEAEKKVLKTDSFLKHRKKVVVSLFCHFFPGNELQCS